MIIRIEENSGFCFGVVKAIGLADSILDSGEELYCLGQIVHNELEVKRLSSKGLKFITNADLPNLKNCKLLLRAHGEPPGTYEIAEKNNIEIIDGTCAIVKRIQKKIRNDGTQIDLSADQIIIFGKTDHPEVRGLVAQVPEKTVVIESLKEAQEVALSGRVYLYAQTTMNPEVFTEIGIILKERLKKSGGELRINNTICPHVSHRKPGLLRFAKENDVIIFVAGSNSSNGKMLYESCKQENERTYYVTEINMIRKEWFDNMETVGISSATSTPQWQIKEVFEKVKELTN